MKTIIYEQHPVSAGRKKELVEQGYKIIDARFKPIDNDEIQKTKPKRKVK